MGDEVFGRRRDIVPPRGKESVVSSSDLFSQDIDTLVVECCLFSSVSQRCPELLTRETTEKGVEHTTQSPHVDRLGIPLILDNFGSSVSNGTTRSHGLFVPNNLG
jgi:hypothetical protein